MDSAHLSDALILTFPDDHAGSRLAIEGNLFERGISFRTVDIDGIPADGISVLLDTAAKVVFLAQPLQTRIASDPAWHEPLLRFTRRNGFLSPYGVSEEALSQGWLRSVVDSMFAAVAVEEAMAYAGLALNNPAFLKSRASRDADALLDAEYAGLLRWLSHPQQPSEWHIHRGKSAEALMLRGDHEVAARYLISTKAYFTREHEYYFDDHLSAFYAPVALARAGVDDSLLPLAHRQLRRALDRRPRIDAHRSYIGYIDDPLFGVRSVEGNGGQISGVNLGLGGHDCVSNEMLHFTATVMVGVGVACGDKELVSEGVALCDHVYRFHRLPNGLLLHLSRRGIPSGAPWGRGQTHALYGLVYLLDALPPDSADHLRLRGYLVDHLRAILPHQDDATGLWRNVIDRPDARPESSCTVGITFALARAIHQGWMDRSAGETVIDRAWTGIRTMMHEGALGSFCRGTYAGGTVSHYLARPQGWGTAPQMLMLAVELHRLGKLVRLPGQPPA